MSYLLENSKIISKQEFKDEEEKYSIYDSYELEEHIILTENKKAFFSIYDIAHFCKKKYKDSKLFLIVHRFEDEVAKQKITEFYIFNTVDIFDKALTSCLVVSEDELLDKQVVIQDNLSISAQMLNTNEVHVILGDNIKEHEVYDYINSLKENASLELFDSSLNFTSNNNIENKEYKIKASRISTVLNSIRILEPKKQKSQKNILLVLLVLLSFYLCDEYMHSFFEDSIKKEKRDNRKLKQELSKYTKDVNFKEDIYNQNLKVIKDLSKKEIYVPKSENE